MSFAELMKKRQGLYEIPNGLTEYSYYAQRDFEELLYTSPSATLVTILEETFKVILNDVKYGVELEDEKYMLTKYDKVVGLGSYVKWDDENWIVTAKERFTDKGHRSYRLKRCNGVMKFTNKKGEIVSLAANIYNKLFYTEGIDKYTSIVMPDGLSSVIVPNNTDSKDLARNMRIIIGEQAFVITYVDRVTQEGITQITLSEVLPDIKDDLEDQVADSPYVDGITGKDSIFLGGSSKYEIDEDATAWNVSNDCIELVSTSSRIVLVKAIKEGDAVLEAVCDNKIYQKTIKVKYKSFD